MRPGERGTAAEQRANLRDVCDALRPLLGERELVVTHGNGPQVGNELLRHERAADEAPPLPLYLAVAQTQAEIGALIESELAPVAERPVACLLTHVVVDRGRSCLREPDQAGRPVLRRGPRQGARARPRLAGGRTTPGRGWRRVVPSPQPLEIVELEAIRALARHGDDRDRLRRRRDPRRPARRPPRRSRRRDRQGPRVVPARRALGAERLVILTEVPAVYRGFGTGRQEELRRLSVDEAEALVAELEPGCMRPKVEASAAFVRADRPRGADRDERRGPRGEAGRNRERGRPDALAP